MIIRAIDELKVEPNKDNKIVWMSIANLFIRDISIRFYEMEFKDLS